MKKFLTLLSILILVSIFSMSAFANNTPPSIPDLFGAEDDTPPTLQPNTSGSSSSGSSSGSYTQTTTTTTTTPPPPKTTTQPTPQQETKEISNTGPEMIYLIVLGLLLIGGYQFAMKRK